MGPFLGFHAIFRECIFFLFSLLLQVLIIITVTKVIRSSIVLTCPFIVLIIAVLTNYPPPVLKYPT